MTCKYCNMEHHSSGVLNLCYSYQSALERITSLKAALREIAAESFAVYPAEHPHCSRDYNKTENMWQRGYFDGRMDGHRAATKIAQDALGINKKE